MFTNNIVKSSNKLIFILYDNHITLNSTLDCFGKNVNNVQLSIETEVQISLCG